jgi:hypothetical protein
MEFQEVIESIRAEEASVQKLFGGDGDRYRNVKRSPQYLAKLGEAANFVKEVYDGKRRGWQLKEALGTSDFSNLFGDILDRALLGSYMETPQVYRNFTRIGSVPDFRTVKRFALNGSESVLSIVPQQAEYPEASVSDAAYSYTVQKYGRRIGFSWEAMVNDDLDALKSIPERFARAARRSESKFVTGLYVDANGPHASLYTVGNANKVTSNPVLSISALQTAYKILAAMRDADGEPIVVDAVELVVPPALQITAQNILNATQLWLDTNASAGTAQQNMVTTNWMSQKVRLSIDPYIPVVASSANGDTSWFLHASPSVGRPALEVGFLRGHESPEIFVKAPNTQSAGASTDPLNGDFDTDSIMYKVRHVFGGTRLDPKATVASNGSGS